MTDLEKEFYPLGAVTDMLLSKPKPILRVVEVREDIILVECAPSDQKGLFYKTNENKTWRWVIKP